jgi:hypothetical protein
MVRMILSTVPDIRSQLLDYFASQLEEVGVKLRLQHFVRHFEIETIPPAGRFDRGEVVAAFYNRRHDRSVKVWIGEFMSSPRQDGIGCKIQLCGLPPGAKPGADHSKRISTPIMVDLNEDDIENKVRDLFEQ